MKMFENLLTDFQNSTIIKIKFFGGQAVLGRHLIKAPSWLTERHGYDPTSQYGMTIVDLKNLGYTDEPFVLSRGQAVLGRQLIKATPWLSERHG